MNSFHHSRGRVYFDIFCVLTIGAASAVAWMQTGASALLAISAVAAVYGLVHATDAPGKSRAVAIAPAEALALETSPAVDALPVAQEETKAPKKKRASRKKQAAVEPAAQLPVVEICEPAIEAEELVEPEVGEDYHPHVTPLFEPQPMVRQMRTFGRKAG